MYIFLCQPLVYYLSKLDFNKTVFGSSSPVFTIILNLDVDLMMMFPVFCHFDIC